MSPALLCDTGEKSLAEVEVDFVEISDTPLCFTKHRPGRVRTMEWNLGGQHADARPPPLSHQHLHKEHARTTSCHHLSVAQRRTQMSEMRTYARMQATPISPPLPLPWCTTLSTPCTTPVETCICLVKPQHDMSNSSHTHTLTHAHIRALALTHTCSSKHPQSLTTNHRRPTLG